MICLTFEKLSKYCSDIPRFANGTLLYFLHSFHAVLCKKEILSIVYCSKSTDFVHYSDLTAQNQRFRNDTKVYYFGNATKYLIKTSLFQRVDIPIAYIN